MLLLSLSAAVLGKAAQAMVRLTYLDLKYATLRFSNEFDLLFSGRILGKKDHARVKSVVLAVIAEGKEKDVIYIGFLHKYYLSQTKGLDKIVLKDVVRRAFSQEADKLKVENPDHTSRYIKIPDKFLVLPNDRIRNINVQYWELSPNSGG